MDVFTEFLLKDAEATGTYLMPAASGPSAAPKDPSPTKTLPKISCVQSRVNVTGKEALRPSEVKQAQYYALPSQQRYPLDRYDHVKQACAYFTRYNAEMLPSERHEYAEHLVKRASMLGISPPEEALTFGGAERADQSTVNMSVDARAAYIEEEKRASIAQVRAITENIDDPSLLAMFLEQFDKEAGIDHLYAHFPDPYEAAYKVASTLTNSPTGSLVVGNDYLSADALKNFMSTGFGAISDMFGEDVAKEMSKDPVGVFNSLPIPQKKLIMRRVNDNGPSQALSS